MPYLYKFKPFVSLLFALLSFVTVYANEPIRFFEAYSPSASLKAKLDKGASAYQLMMPDHNRFNNLIQQRSEHLDLPIVLPNGSQAIASLDEVGDKIMPSLKVEEKNAIGVNSINYQKGLYYQGFLKGDVGSGIAISFFPNGEIIGVAWSPKYKGNIVIGRVTGLGFEPATAPVVVYNDLNLKKANDFHCDEEVLPKPSELIKSRGQQLELENHRRVQAPTAPNACRSVSNYWEAGFTHYQMMGSNTTNTTNHMTGYFNVVNRLYSFEGVNHTLSRVRVNTVADGTRLTSSFDALSDFSVRMDADAAYVEDLAHYFSGNAGGLGGVAYVDVLCFLKQYRVAFSDIQSPFSGFPVYSWTVQVTTHEMGHNVASPHTQSCGWTLPGGGLGMLDSCYTAEDVGNGICYSGPRIPREGTIMSYCHLNGSISFFYGFGNQPGTLINTAFENATCISLPPLPAAPVVSVSGPTQLPFGGTVTLTGPATGPWLWNNGETTRSIVVNQAGYYRLQVISGGCTSKASIPVIVTAPSNYCVPSHNSSTCYTTNVINNVTVASQAVFNGACTSPYFQSSSTANITAGSNATVSVTTNGNAIVAAWIDFDQDGQFEATEFQQVALSTTSGVPVNAVFSIPTNALTGLTGIRIRTRATANANGPNDACTTFGSGSTIDALVNILPACTPPATPSISASGPTTFCAPGSVTLTAPAGFSYIWSTGETTRSILVTSSNTVTVRTIVSGCTSLASAPVIVTVNTAPLQPSITPSAGTVICSGTPVTLNAPLGFDNYIWSNGANTQSINVTSAGNYTVRVVLSGCTSVVSAAVSVTTGIAPTAPTISAGGPTTFPSGGSVTLTSTAGSSYLWSTGQTTQSISVSASGTYTCRIISGGCTSNVSNSIVVTVTNAYCNPLFVATTCSDADFVSGVILNSTVLENRLTCPALYYLSSNTSGVLTRGAASTIQVRVTSGSIISVWIDYDQDGFLESSEWTQVTTASTAGNFSVAIINVPASALTGTTRMRVRSRLTGNINGSVDACTSFGSGSAIDFNVTIIDPCTPPATPSITAGGPTSFCEPGSVTLTAPAGFSYIWSTGETTRSITVTTSSTVTVQTILSGCTSAVSSPVFVTANPTPATPSITATGGTVVCSGAAITLEAPFGFAGYIWSNGAITQTNSVTAAGSYTVRVISNGCTSSASAPVVVTTGSKPAKPVITASGPTTFNAPGSVDLTAPAGFSYLWSNGAITRSINVSTSGVFTVQTISGGCTSDVSDPITVVVISPYCIPDHGSAGACYAGDFIANVSVGATNLYNATTCPGTYFISPNTTSLTRGQSVSFSVTSSTNSIISVWIDYDQDGLLEVTEWSQVTTSSTSNLPAIITLSVPGTATLGLTRMRVRTRASGSQNGSTDACTQFFSGASVDFNVTIVNPCTPPASPTATVTAGNQNICGAGTVTLTATGGTNYLWSTGETTRSIVVSSAGSYTVMNIVAGCTSAISNAIVVTVNPVPPAPTILSGGSTILCDGQNVTLSIANQSGGDITNVSTLAGGIVTGFNNGTGASARFSSPGGLTEDANGNIYVGDASNHRIRRITPSGVVTTLAGSGTASLVNGIGTAASFSNPTGLTIDPSGNIYVADYSNNVVRKITSAGVVTTLASIFGGPLGIAYNQATNSLFVTAADDNRIWQITLSGIATLYAGNSLPGNTDGPLASATFNAPTGIAINSQGDIFIACQFGHTLRKISAGNVTTIAGAYLVPGAVNGPATTVARLNRPAGVAVDASGDVYIVDRDNITVRLLRNGNITTVAGSGIAGTNDGLPLTASFNNPYAIMVGSDNNLYLAHNFGVRKLERASLATFTWSNSATGTSIVVPSSAAGTYTATATVNGCVSANSNAIVVTNGQPPVPTITGGTAVCAGGSIVLTSSATSGNEWYRNGSRIVPAETGQTLTVTQAGTYAVRVGNGTGCESQSADQVVNLTAPPSTPTIVANGSTTICSGSSVTIDGPAGLGYLWSNGATTQSINVSTSGSYTLQTIANGCTSAVSNVVTVTVNSLPTTPTITANSTTTFCAGGSVQLSAPSGLSYIWSNGATSQNINVNTTGAYSVRTIANGCTSAVSNVISVSVTPLPSTPTVSVSGPTTFCTGGSVTLSAPAGFSYIWSTGATTQTINVSTTGSYTVRTIASGCTSLVSNTVAVSVNAPPTQPTISTSGSTTICAGGSVTLSGPAGLSYLWSTGATTQSINVTNAGNYTLQTIANNCTSAVSNAVTVAVTALPSTPTITPSGATTICAGGSVTLTAPSSTGYVWSTGATTQSINVSTAGNYTVQVISNSCTSLASSPVAVSVTPLPTTPTITAAGSTTFCSGGSVDLTAPAGFSYIWSNGATTQSISASVSGNYTVRVIAGGCTSLASNTIAVNVTPNPTTPTISVAGSTTICTGGSVTLSAPAGFNYLWSNGETTQSVIISNAGSYSVRTISASCTSASSAPVTVSVNPIPPTPTITALGATTFCSGGNVQLAAPSGFTGYIWSNGATTQTITASASGNFTVRTIVNGCTSQVSSPVAVSVNTTPSQPIVTANGPTTFCDGSSVTLNAPAGFSYLWSTGATTASLNVIASGSYTVQTISNGCTSAASAPIVVTVNAIPSAPTISAGGPTTICAGGSVSLSGPAGFSYLWSTGATSRTINVTSAGSYTLRVISSGCTSAVSPATLVSVQSSVPAPTIQAAGSTTFCAGGNVVINAPAGYDGYLWSNGATTQNLTASTAGTYTLRVISGTCTSAVSNAVTVTLVTSIGTPTISPTRPTTFCQGDSTVLYAPSGFVYEWSTGATTDSIVVKLSGSYSVRVISGTCTSATSSAIAVTVNAVPAKPSITASGLTTLCAGGSVTLTAPAGFSYNWSTGATTQQITVNSPGSYSVTVSANSCQSRVSDPVNVVVNPLPTTPTITALGNTTFCSGSSVTLAAPSGADSYIWSSGETTQLLTATQSGNYSVQIISNGCTSAVSSAVAVTVNPTPAKPVISANGPTNLCAGNSVVLTAPAGFSYAWSTGATTQSIIANSSGNFTVSLISGNCTSEVSDPVAVSVLTSIPVPTITPSGSLAICSGDSVVLTAPAGYSYLWSNNATTQSIAIKSAGTYTVQAISGTCTSSVSAPTVVTVNPTPTVPSITANGATTFCSGDSVTLTAPVGGSYVWSTGATTASIVVKASGSYTVQAISGTCTSAVSAPTVVTVNPTPTAPSITANGATTFCSGDSVTLTAPVGGSYVWSTGAATASIVVKASGSYTVQAISGTCTSAVSAPTVVTVNPTPSVPSITANGATTFCSGDSVTLTAPVGGSYVWSTGATTASIVVKASGSYTVQAISGTCTSAVSAPTVVTVNPTPTAPSITASGATTFCFGDSVTLTAPVGGSYVWSTGATTASIVVKASGSYTVQSISGTCTSAVSAPTVVTVNAKPGPITITRTVDTLEVTIQTGWTYQWSSSLGQIAGAVNPRLTVTTPGRYTVRVTNASNCSDTASFTVITNTPSVGSVVYRIYPNPAHDQLNIELGANAIVRKYFIKNVLGQTLISGEVQGGKSAIDLSALPQGPYWLEVSGAGTTKFVRE